MAATRLYPANQYPGIEMRLGANGTWGRQALFGRSWQPDYPIFELQSTKTGKGLLANYTAKTNQQGNYDFFFWKMITPAMEAGTISGDLTICFMVHCRWITATTNTADSVVRYKLHAYTTQGSTLTVRDVLIDNVVDTSDWGTGAAQVWKTFTTAMTTRSAQAGDRICIEVGARVVSSPTPSATYPPTAWTSCPIRGTGMSALAGTPSTDAVNGDTSTSRAPWVEFADGLPAFQAAPAAPANDACADAITIATLPYTSAAINSTSSTDTNKQCWWTWTATFTGRLFVHALGSNYPVEIQRFTGGCGGLTSTSSVANDIEYNGPRCFSYAIYSVVSGTQYWFRVRHSTTESAFNAPDTGGVLRFHAFQAAQAPVEDDLYLPAGYVCAVRDGTIIHFTPTWKAFNPTGVAIDYTERSIDSLNGGTHASERLLIGLHNEDLVELLDLHTLNYDEFEEDFISTNNSGLPADEGMSPAQLDVGRDGRVLVGRFGDGYLYVAGEGSLPAKLNTVSQDVLTADVLEWDSIESDNQSGGPFTPVRHNGRTVEHTNPWALTRDEATDWVYYTTSGFYEPVGGASDTIRRFHLGTGTDEAFATITLSGTNNPGVKGMQAIPGNNGLLVCNGDEVLRLDNLGNTLQTYTPSIALDSQSLCDVKLTADGTQLWVVDEATTRLFLFDITTGAEVATYQPYLLHGTLVQMAIYQPEGVLAPPGGNQIDCPHGSFTPNILQKSGSYLRTMNRIQASYDTTVTLTGSYTREFRPKSGTYEPTLGTLTGSF